MAERRPRTYSPVTGRFWFGLAGFWVLMALLNTFSDDRLPTVFCLVSALMTGLQGANETWWHGQNRWFRPAMYAILLAMVAIAVVFAWRLVSDLRDQF